MMKKQALFSSLLAVIIFLSAVMCFSSCASETFTAMSETIVPVCNCRIPDHGTLILGYTESRLSAAVYGESRKNHSAGSRFDGVQKILYDALVNNIVSVAEGKLASTEFEIASGIESLSWTEQELGCTLIENGAITD